MSLIKHIQRLLNYGRGIKESANETICKYQQIKKLNLLISNKTTSKLRPKIRAFINGKEVRV
jgi:hypothetical protein